MVRKEKLQAGCTGFPTECFRSPHAPALGTRKALVLQVRSGRGSDTVTESYLLKRQVHLLRFQLKRVAYKGQARGPWREVLWTPPFEEISKEANIVLVLLYINMNPPRVYTCFPF